MASFSTLSDRREATAARPLSRALAFAARPEVLAILLLAILAAFRAQGSVEPDVSWQLWVADRIHHGARLYRDIVEVNPPLWYWMAIPVDALARFLTVRPDALLILIMAVAAALSVVATARLLPPIAANRRRLLLAYAALILLGMPWVHVGQREQILLIGAVPYIALVTARRSGRKVPVSLALLVGIGAALGFALKHYFLITPALLELWLFLGRGRSWRPFRPETLAVIVVGAAYAGAILIWARDFLTLALPLVRLTYGATGAPHFVDLFQPPIVIAFLIGGFVALYHRKLATRAPLALAFVIAAAGFAAAYFIQAKGWVYHSIPFVGCVSLALASLLAEVDEAPALLRLAGPALLALPLATAAQEERADVLPSPDVVRSVAGLPAGTPVGFLASGPALGWSVTLQHHLRYPSRYSSYWMIRAIVRSELSAHPDPRLEQVRRNIAHDTVVDFECVAPRRIVIARPAPDNRDRDAFDILPFFLQDPQFARMFSHYRPIYRGPTVETYELASPLERPVASSCPKGI
jgi:hypothetical protein